MIPQLSEINESTIVTHSYLVQVLSKILSLQPQESNWAHKPVCISISTHSTMHSKVSVQLSEIRESIIEVCETIHTLV